MLGTASSIGDDTMEWVNTGVIDPPSAVIWEEAQRASGFYLDTFNYFAGEPGHDFCVDDGSQR